MDKKLFPIFLVMFTEVIGFSLLLPFLPYYATELGASPFVISGIAASFSFFQFLSAPVLGKLSDKYGRKPLFMLSQFSTFVSFLILGFATSIRMIYISRIVDGVFGSNMVVSQAYIADITAPKDRTKVYTYAGAVSAFGFMIGPAVGGYLTKYGYDVPAFVAAAISLIAFYFVTQLEETVTRSHDIKFKRSDFIAFGAMKRAWKNPDLRTLLFEFLVFSFAFSMTMPNFALFLSMKFAVDAATVGAFIMFVGIFRVILQMGVMPRLIKRFGDETVKITGFFAMALSFVAYTNRSLLYPAATLFAYGGSAIRPVIMSEVSKTTKKDTRGGSFGVFDAYDSFVRVGAPLIGGAILDFLSTDLFALAGCLVMTLGALFAIKNKFRPSKVYRPQKGMPSEDLHV